jgi:hypothetical protein
MLLAIALSAPTAYAQAEHVRWDIVSLHAGILAPGGIASARANDNSKITLTGSGTFVAPGGGPGSNGSTTGGGMWTAFDSSGTTIGTGTYEVTGLVRWEQAPGTPPAVVDTIDDGQASAGLVVLRVVYSDGDRGILVVSCHLVGTPNSVFEGITASKGYVDYWNREGPVPGVDADRTVFHVR